MSDRATSERQTASVAAGQAESSLFPLPLVPFEHYMLTDDRPGYPMTFPVRVELEGIAERSAMEAAFQDALVRHPLLNCRVVRRKAKWCWVPCDDHPPALVWEATPPPGRTEIRPIDLRRFPPLEARLFVDGNRTVLELLFHHAASDGIGALVFLGDILAGYAQRVGGGRPGAKSLSLAPELLRDRGRFKIDYPRELSVWEIARASLRETANFHTRWPRVLAGGEGGGRSAEGATSTMVVGRLDADVFARFVRRAEQSHVTANDLLLRDLLLTVYKWNRDHGGRRGGWLRVNVPTSLRARRDLRMPAANVLGYALLTQRGRLCKDREALLRSIASDMKAIRDWSMGSFFVEALRSTVAIPGGMWLGTRLMRQSATVVFSNVGDATRRFRARIPRVDGHLVAGNLRLVNIVGTPPVRPGTRLAIAMLITGGVPYFGFRADSRYLSENDVERFFDEFTRYLHQSADEWRNVGQ